VSAKELTGEWLDLIPFLERLPSGVQCQSPPLVEPRLRPTKALTPVTRRTRPQRAQHIGPISSTTKRKKK